MEMGYLLDTHTFLWFISEPEKLGDRARELLIDGENVLYWSAASQWEVSIKVSLGKLELQDGWQLAFEEERRANFILDLPIRISHCQPTETLPWHHRDPFDRLLVSQAISEDLTIVSKDKYIRLYDVECVW